MWVPWLTSWMPLRADMLPQRPLKKSPHSVPLLQRPQTDFPHLQSFAANPTHCVAICLTAFARLHELRKKTKRFLKISAETQTPRSFAWPLALVTIRFCHWRPWPPSTQAWHGPLSSRLPGPGLLLRIWTLTSAVSGAWGQHLCHKAKADTLG